MGVAKTKKNLLFSIPGSSWFIYTPTRKINILKLKHPTKTFKNPNKIPTLSPSNHQIPISHPISLKLTKINTFTHHTPQSKPTIQNTFFLYKYKNPKKIHIFTDYQLFIKNNINNIKLTLISNSKREYKNATKIQTNTK